MEDYNKLINFKWGTVPFKKEINGKLSNKWFFYKPNTGNLTPAPSSPFGGITSNPYYGGYSSGNSTLEKCAWSTPKKLRNRKFIGFTHFNPNGSGDIKIFYNYFLVKPSIKRCDIIREYYRLNGYDIKTTIYDIESLVNKNTVNYKIKTKEHITIIPGYSGLDCKEYRPKIYKTFLKRENNLIKIFVDYESIAIYWVIKLNKYENILVRNGKIYVYGNDVEFTLSYSLYSFENAINYLKSEYSNESLNYWNNLLSKIDIESDDDTKKLFYTSLHNAIKTPFISNEDDQVYDYMTLWDMYKTAFPLFMLIYKNEAAKIINGFKYLYLDDHFVTSRHFYKKELISDNNQAICLANIIMSQACLYNVDFNKEYFYPLQLKEINKYIHSNLPIKPEFSHNLDLIDCINAFASVYKNVLNKNVLDVKSNLERMLYDENGVLLKNDGNKYYEGSNVNYSFRTSISLNDRLRFTDKMFLEKELDRFFGYSSSKVKFFNKPALPQEVKDYGNKVKRFEGLNNEPDMETPYIYGYLNRYDKQNEVLTEIMRYSFNSSDDGIPGNDDSGALSSFLVFNLLGLMPIVGTKIFRIGCPKIDKAILHLEKDFVIIVKRESKDSIYLDSVYLNEKPLKEYQISYEDIIKGSTLYINLK